MRHADVGTGAALLMGALALGACGDSAGTGAGLISDPGDSDGSGAWYGGTTSTGSGYSTGTGMGSGPGPVPIEPPPPPPPEDLDCAALDSSKPTILYLSADDSNSMASPVIARELIEGGMLPNIPIRTYEFLNYYDMGYPAAPAGELAVFPEMAVTDIAGELDFQIGVRSFDAPAARRPMTITFVLDTSGSMGGEGIRRERAAIRAIAKNLAAGDVINMTTWNTGQLEIMSGHVATGPDDDAVLAAAAGLMAGGGTDLDGGLQAGYALAQQHYGENRLNRVVLISDGGANVGETNGQIIGNSSQDADAEGIYLVGVHTGPAVGFSDDSLMNAVTDLGRGAYVYLDSEEEADRILNTRFDEVMEVAARGVQVELTMPWYFQMHEFFGEEFSENPDEIEPQHLAPGDAMVFSQVLKACSPDVVVGSDPVKVRVTWTKPLTYVSKERVVETTVQALLDAGAPHMPKAKAIVAFAEALKSGEPAKLQTALDAVNAANPGDSDAELGEMADLIAAHQAML